MFEVTIAILGLLTVVVGAVIKFWKPKHDPTVQDRLDTVDRELAERDATAVNARLERALRVPRDARGDGGGGSGGGAAPGP